MNIDITAWVIALVGVVVLGGLIYWLTSVVWRGRMMRCPETGAVSVVRVASAARGDEKAPGLMVTQCDLWPQKKDCAQGCLSRYGETASGWRVNLNALRPFEPR